MKTTIQLLIAAAGVAGLMAVATPVMAAGNCLDPASVQAALASGRIAPLSTVLADAGLGRGYKVVSADVCEENGQLMYVVAVLASNGEAKKVVLPAGR